MPSLQDITASVATTARHQHPASLRGEALVLHRLDWGGALKIAKYLSRRHSIDLSEWSVREWIATVPRDLDPLAFLAD